RFRAELHSRWRTWLTLAVLAGIAGGLVLAGMAAARRTDSALARHREAYRFPDATAVFSNSASRSTIAQVAALPQVQAYALEAELGDCARDAASSQVNDNGPPAR